ncbi:MAG TPA: hypothetical protein VF809_00005 [Candidatus Saccharimonadales bacterium]
MFETSSEYREPVEDHGGLTGEYPADGPDADFSFASNVRDEGSADGEAGTVEDEVAAMMAAHTRSLGEEAVAFFGSGGSEAGEPYDVEGNYVYNSEPETRRLRMLEEGGEASTAATQPTDVMIDAVDSSIYSCANKHTWATGDGPAALPEVRRTLESLRDMPSFDGAAMRDRIIELYGPAIDSETGQEIVGSGILEVTSRLLLDSSEQDAALARVMSQPRFQVARAYMEDAATGWNDSRSATVDAAEEVISAYSDLMCIARDPNRPNAYREAIDAVIGRIDRAGEHIGLAIERSGEARANARRAAAVFGPPSDVNRPQVSEPDFSRPAYEWGRE